jgi:6-phospho-beta-glucosidase
VTEATTRLDEALAGADVALVQVRIGGLAARAFDESFPQAVGLPGEETLGPGGLANAIRTLRALEEIWEGIKRMCPDALVLVLSNPAGIVREAAEMHGLLAVEVCDSPVAFVGDVADRLCVPRSAVMARYVGMNHVGWYVPTDDAQLELLSDHQAVAPDVVRAHGALPLGYVRYYVDTDRILETQRGRPTRAQELMDLDAAARARLRSGQMPDAQVRPAPWYRLAVVPALDGWANGSGESMIMGCANGVRLACLRARATIESAARFPAPCRIEVQQVVDLPSIPSTLLYCHGVYEELAIAAAASPDRVTLLRALLANPMVATASQAEALVDALLAADPALLGSTTRGEDRS